MIRRLVGGGLALLLAPLMAFTVLSSDCATLQPSLGPVGPAGPVGADSVAVAREVHRVGVALAVSDRVMLAAFETGLVESELRNLPAGHADSAGVFQQRPSQGWGSHQQVTDVTYAANAFFLGAGGNRGAVDYDQAGFEGTAGQLAARVQRPRADLEWKYDARETDARAWIALVGGSGGSMILAGLDSPPSIAPPAAPVLARDGVGAAIPDGPRVARADVPPPGPGRGRVLGPASDRPVPPDVQPVTTAAALAVRALGFDGDLGGRGPRTGPSDHPAGYAIDTMVSPIGTRPDPEQALDGDTIAAFFVANMDALNVRYVIWDNWIHYGDSWERYEHRDERSGAVTGGPRLVTIRHEDHVHVSLNRDGVGTGDIVGVGLGAAGGCGAAPLGAGTSPDGATVIDGYALPAPRDAIAPDRPDRPHHTYPAWDLAVPVGTSAFAVTAGIVIQVNPGGRCGYGLTIDGHDGVRYGYCHATDTLVQLGEQVAAGQLVMRTGGAPGAPGAGSSTGPHLHLQMKRDGALVCPQPLVRALHDADPLPSIAELPTGGCVS